jgi:hypothetical protein
MKPVLLLALLLLLDACQNPSRIQAELAEGHTQADVARTYAVDPTTIGRLQAAP